MSRLKMGFTEVLAAAAARGTPLAAILLNKPQRNTTPFLLFRAAWGRLFFSHWLKPVSPPTIFAGGRENGCGALLLAEKPCSLGWRPAGACSPAESRYRPVGVLAVALLCRRGALGPRLIFGSRAGVSLLSRVRPRARAGRVVELHLSAPRALAVGPRGR